MTDLCMKCRTKEVLHGGAEFITSIVTYMAALSVILTMVYLMFSFAVWLTQDPLGILPAAAALEEKTVLTKIDKRFAE